MLGSIVVHCVIARHIEGVWEPANRLAIDLREQLGVVGTQLFECP
jgi:hypothetical protein